MGEYNVWDIIEWNYMIIAKREVDAQITSSSPKYEFNPKALFCNISSRSLHFISKSLINSLSSITILS